MRFPTCRVQGRVNCRTLGGRGTPFHPTRDEVTRPFVLKRGFPKEINKVLGVKTLKGPFVSLQDRTVGTQESLPSLPSGPLSGSVTSIVLWVPVLSFVPVFDPLRGVGPMGVGDVD